MYFFSWFNSWIQAGGAKHNTTCQLSQTRWLLLVQCDLLLEKAPKGQAVVLQTLGALLWERGARSTSNTTFFSIWAFFYFGLYVFLVASFT